MTRKLTTIAIGACVSLLAAGQAAEPKKGPTPVEVVDAKGEGHREGGMIGSITISGPPPFQPKPAH